MRKHCYARDSSFNIFYSSRLPYVRGLEHHQFYGSDSGPSLCNQNMGSKSIPMPLLATNTKVLKDNHWSRRSLTKHDPEQQTILKCLKINARSASKLARADHLDRCNSLLASMDTTMMPDTIFSIASYRQRMCGISTGVAAHRRPPQPYKVPPKSSQITPCRKEQ
jgi:hypothetical protein